MSKKKPKRNGIPLESLLLDLSSPKYASNPLRASQYRKEIVRMLGESAFEKLPEEGRTIPACYTLDEYLEVLAAPAIYELQRAANELSISDAGRRHVNARHDAPGGYREQKRKHREAYQAAYDEGQHSTHSSFAKEKAGTPGFAGDERVILRHLEGMPSLRKKKTTHTT